MQDVLLYALAGFLAQTIDGALGMAYGVTVSSLLMSMGLPPATVSATVHAAECFSTGASALSHRAMGNIDRALFCRLVLPGIAGATLGAFFLVSLPVAAVRPWIAAYLFLMGGFIVFKALHAASRARTVRHVAPLGFGGAFVDAVGGGGWGPIVATTLIAGGNDARKSIGTTNAVEFFVTFTASVTFLVTLGFTHLHIVAGLALGSVVAAPLGAWLCARIPLKPLMFTVGVLVMALSARNFYTSIF